MRIVNNRTLKRETESLTCAAQEQALQNNAIKGKNDKSQKETKLCMMYGLRLMRQSTLM